MNELLHKRMKASPCRDWEKSPDNTFQGILVQKFPEDLCNINYNAFHLLQCLSTDIELIDIFLIEAKHLYI